MGTTLKKWIVLPVPASSLKNCSGGSLGRQRSAQPKRGSRGERKGASVGAFIGRSLMPLVTSVWYGRDGEGWMKLMSRCTKSEIISWNTEETSPRFAAM